MPSQDFGGLQRQLDASISQVRFIGKRIHGAVSICGRFRQGQELQESSSYTRPRDPRSVAEPRRRAEHSTAEGAGQERPEAPEEYPAPEQAALHAPPRDSADVGRSARIFFIV